MNLARLQRWEFAALLCLFLAWRIVSVNLTEFASGEDAAMAARWHIDTTNSLLNGAIEQASISPDEAFKYALQAAWETPTDGRSFIMMVLLLEREHHVDVAKHLMRLVAKLFPSSPDIQLQMGHFWVRQGELTRAVEGWGVAMEMQPNLRPLVFPDLLALIELPQNQPLVSPLFAKQSSWSDEFFLYAVKNAAYPATLKMLYLARQGAKTPATAEMRKAYLDRLMHDAMWADAYFVWMNSLNEQQIKGLGNVYDGGFELDAPEEGFAWHFTNAEGVLVVPEVTFGTSGSRALHVAFKGTHRIQPMIASQTMMLGEGGYKLSGKVRLDNIAAVNGLNWVVACGQADLAATGYFIEKSQWQHFEVPFKVPANCPAQEIRLMVHPVDAKRQDLTGSVWFDDMAIAQDLPAR